MSIDWFERKRRDAAWRANRQKLSKANRWRLSMRRTILSPLLASAAGALIVSLLLVGVTTSVIA
jgi:hypothetical protein